MTAVEKIIAEINNELQTLESLHGKEIFGRKVGLAFAKRVAEQAKEMEKEQKIEFAKLHVQTALKAVENEMILQASSVKHWYLPETIK